ncbi:hypothetical protein EON66_05365 [archaeon]|nr:MAG: hypothetical protein EON66_05365 [archaeon]
MHAWCRILTALISMNEAPYIRFTETPRGMAEVVATALHKQMKSYRNANPRFMPWGSAGVVRAPLRERVWHAHAATHARSIGCPLTRTCTPASATRAG